MKFEMKLNLLPFENSFEYIEDRKGHDFRYSLSSDKIKKKFGLKFNKDIDTNIKNNSILFDVKIHESYNSFFSKSELETQCILNNLDELLKSNEINEIILVDDNPDTEISKKLLQFKKNSKINIVKNKYNKGFVKTINEHWNPKDKFYLIINSDIIIKNLNIKLLLKEFDKNKYLSTITIPTNSASIFSIYPHIVTPNQWFRKVNKLNWNKPNYNIVTCLGHFFLINNSTVQENIFLTKILA